MRKEELRSLKRIYATPKMIQLAKDNKKRMEYSWCWDKNKKEVRLTEFDLWVRCQTRGGFLMICVFLPEWLEKDIRHPVYEVYCNLEGDEYITRKLDTDGDEERWSRTMFENLDYIYHSTSMDNWLIGADRRVWQNPEGMNTIQRLLKTDKKGVFGLIEWQRKVKEKKIAEAEAREKAPWDADMRLVPQIMPSFERWMQREAADQYFIIYEYKGREPDEGWCSGCRRFVPVVHPRHNKKGKCQRCGKDITYKAAGRIRTLSTGWYRAQCMQKIPGGIVVREFKQYQYYRDTVYTDPHVITSETKRVLVMDDGTARCYVYGMYKNKEHRFTPDRYGHIMWSTKGRLYSGNIAALKRTVLKTSSIDIWLRRKEKRLPTGVVEFLAEERGNPAIEKLAKIGMFRLAEELIHIQYKEGRELIDQDATELAKIIKIDRERLKRLKAMNGGIDHL